MVEGLCTSLFYPLKLQRKCLYQILIKAPFWIEIAKYRIRQNKFAIIADI